MERSFLKKMIWLRGVLSGESVTWQTVSGTSPLSLPGALARGIRRLAQFGKCEQDATPTPAAPQAIRINNGTLEMVDDELPGGYKRLESITYAAKTYYDTGEKLNGSDVITLTCQPSITSGQNLFGAYKSADAINYSLYAYGSTGTGWYFRYGETLYRPKTDNSKRTLTVGPGDTSGFSTNVTVEPETFVTDEVAWIGALPNSSSAKYSGTLYGDIVVGTRLRWIPCERVSDGVIGYYEIVNGRFLEPNGDAPVAGNYDTSHLTVLSVVGVPEVLTVSASGASPQTASVVGLFSVGDHADEQDLIRGGVVRRCKVVVMDGTESTLSFSSSRLRISDADKAVEKSEMLCTHFIYSDAVSTSCPDGGFGCGAASTNIWFNNSALTSLEMWREWLSTQYAAGTPVIIIYPLAEPVSEKVAAQPLQTAAGDNVVSVTANVSAVPLEVKYAT